MVRVEGKLNGEIDVKRFYLEGVKIISKCPNCNKESIFDGDIEYLGYPEANAVNLVWFCCGHCDEEWKEKVKLNIEIVPME